MSPGLQGGVPIPFLCWHLEDNRQCCRTVGPTWCDHDLLERSGRCSRLTEQSGGKVEEGGPPGEGGRVGGKPGGEGKGRSGMGRVGRRSEPTVPDVKRRDRKDVDEYPPSHFLLLFLFCLFFHC
jgi:hypothetical protein